jgi:hypothetical protein
MVITFLKAYGQRGFHGKLSRVLRHDRRHGLHRFIDSALRAAFRASMASRTPDSALTLCTHFSHRRTFR